MQSAISKQEFGEMEERLLQQVLRTSRDLIESFKFRVILNSATPRQNTAADLKAFRQRHWDRKVGRAEAYRKYVSLF